MSRVIVLGAGIAGHTAATFLRRGLSKEHEVVVVSPNSNYQWIPSNIWVGVDRMKSKEVIFPLAPLYKRKGIDFKQALVETFYPEGSAQEDKPHVSIKYVVGDKKDQVELVTYDYLINATGPKLNFEATPGLLPGTNKAVSVCTYGHATEASEEFMKAVERMKKGEHQRILIGTGHPKATCQGAAFEYILNVENELRRHKVRDKATVTWISNESELGDFGVDGGMFNVYGKPMRNYELVEQLFGDRDIKYILGAGVNKVENGKVHYETLDGTFHDEEYDLAMLIPSFSGHGFKAYDKTGGDITEKLFKGFMVVDADYTPKPFEEWSVRDWPETYQNPSFANIFAPGIAFAPPHTISKPMKSPNGTEIFPAPPRTGMPSGVSAKVVADNVIHMIKHNTTEIKHKASMGNMGAACVASAAYGLTKGRAVTMTMFPIIPDYEKYPETKGRDFKNTVGEYGIAGHWIKYVLHIMFIYKAKMKPFWWLIPE